MNPTKGTPILSKMLERPDGGMTAERIASEFTDMVGYIVRRERKAVALSKRRARLTAPALCEQKPF